MRRAILGLLPVALLTWALSRAGRDGVMIAGPLIVASWARSAAISRSRSAQATRASASAKLVGRGAETSPKQSGHSFTPGAGVSGGAGGSCLARGFMNSVHPRQKEWPHGHTTGRTKGPRQIAQAPGSMSAAVGS